MSTFVLLHGAFHGAWCWARVTPLLRARGHAVFTPTQTGVGERAHLLHRSITLETFVQDLVAVIESEELLDVVLVGHSFGGIAVTGAADRIPSRIRSLIYLDSVIPRSGITPLDLSPAEVAAERRRLALEDGGLSVVPPDPGFFGVSPGPDAEWVRRRMTPQPFGALNSSLTFANPPGNGLPCTYIVCTAPLYAPLAPHRDHARAQPGWAWRELATGHDAMITAPAATADLLMELAP